MISTVRHDAVLQIVIDRPERRNALDADAVAGLLAAVDEAEKSDCRVVVLSGAEGHFCSGADLQTVQDEGFVPALRTLLERLRGLSVPVVAGIEGVALGAGTQLALAADLRTATADARFGIPAARLGLMVDQWTVNRLVSMVGQSTARSMLLAAEVVQGEALHAAGFVNRLGGVDAALEWAQEIAALAPRTLVGHKIGCNDAEELDRQTDAYQVARQVAWSSDDLAEGLAAFNERRPAVFRGT
ncbi:MAG: enoyl-CoA hydratase/isomerase family protein [Acidimicrobiia bacterium]|nr:enoyl-CoA hydratase/isomerase family protein [Acidimicrobiia bacterium]